MEKPCVRLSTTHAAFPPPNQLHARLRACLPCLEAAFARLDVGGEGLILLSELRMLLTDAFAAAGQGEPEEAVVATLTNLYEREGTRRSDGKVVLSLVYASEGVAACADMLEEECTLGRPEALKRVSSLAVKEARARDRTVSMEPSFEGTARPRLPPTSPVPSPHPTMFSTLELSSSGSALASPKPQKERESLPAVAQRSVPLGETLSVDPSTSLLVVADAASSSSATLTSPRLLTAGPMGSGEASSPRRGMNLGALRMAQLTGEAVLGGREPPSSQTAFRLAGPAYVSSIMRDFGDYGSKPADLPVTEPGIAGYAQTIKELTAGTTRATLHPPFYTGHVPKEPHGASQAFGLGAEQRSSFHRSTNLIVSKAGLLPSSTRLCAPLCSFPPPPHPTLRYSSPSLYPTFPRITSSPA